MRKGEFRTISCPSCESTVFRAIYHYNLEAKAIGVVTLQCNACSKEINMCATWNVEMDYEIMVEYHETEDDE